MKQTIDKKFVLKSILFKVLFYLFKKLS